MKHQPQDRRRSKRIFFSVQDQVSADFQSPAPHMEPMTGSIMDFSPEGMGITIEKATTANLNQGDRIVLMSVRGASSLSFLRDLEMEVRWVLDHRALAHLGLGCQFIDAPREIEEGIREFMETYAEKF